ncbi:MAG: hypothetical protein CGU28_16655 [Candidatus Dactylopiibacterium carminicum]|uniref:Uncharacterized protein n=1 Tax=Candidatus Dactylopiibacterium carminicum TaxID=857335 RepID=A0ABQ7HKX8_9RHOO|nr:hypothetical protein BGI27_16635 [Candidatus Dactylopiibacterium carminicum]PAS92423.1 MAG: hypothetical protein CGU28_16655 [Candidatus Dactylopiibacterium carminicum]PAS95651.1 MAG: hypothetical protein BSR46_16665 [Candidatus Dactylopiibacterium carminicum]
MQVGLTTGSIPKLAGEGIKMPSSGYRHLLKLWHRLKQNQGIAAHKPMRILARDKTPDLLQSQATADVHQGGGNRNTFSTLQYGFRA